MNVFSRISVTVLARLNDISGSDPWRRVGVLPNSSRGNAVLSLARATCLSVGLDHAREERRANRNRAKSKKETWKAWSTLRAIAEAWTHAWCWNVPKQKYFDGSGCLSSRSLGSESSLNLSIRSVLWGAEHRNRHIESHFIV
jgi:hypothetical protein